MVTRIHHFGVVVQDLREAASRFIADLGYQSIDGATGHDPVQTIHYQFLSPPGGGPYLELLAPDGPVSRVAATFKRGNCLHHLCYATPDIETTCAQLSASGMVLIHEPVPAVAFQGRRIAWLQGPDRVLTELVEEGIDSWRMT